MCTIHILTACALCAQTTYYISSSGGNDGNDGKSEATSFKTLTKAAELNLTPGDSVLLKRGDTWKESFFPKGSGTPESPITISSYGEGPRARIAPGREKIYAIRLVNVAGYKITDLEITDCYGGVVTWTEKTYNHKYLWIENVYFHDITGKDTRFGGWGSLPTPPDLLYGMGVSICGTVEEKDQNILSDITIKNCEFDKCDVGIEVIGRDYDPTGKYDRHGHDIITNNAFKNVNIIDTNIRRSYRTGGVMLYCTNGGIAKNVLIDETGYEDVGMWWGVAAFQCARVANYLIEDCTFSNTIKGHSPDGQGFDFEADCQNITVRNCKFLYNDGPAILWFGGTWKGSNQNNIVENCYFEGNNRKRVYDDLNFMIWHADNTGVIRNSEVRLSNDFQVYKSYPIVFDKSNKIYDSEGNLIYGAPEEITFEDDFAGDLSKWKDAETAVIENVAMLPANGTFGKADTKAKDFFVEAEATFAAPETEAGLFFRMRSPNKYWAAKWTLKDGFDSYIRLVEVEDGKEREIKRFGAPGMKHGRKFLMRVEAVEDFIKVYADGSLMGEVQMGKNSLGETGLWKGEGGKAAFDKFAMGKAKLLDSEKVDVKPNYAKGATITATSFRGEDRPERVADQSLLTRFTSEGANESVAQSVCIDMPKAQKFNTIILYPANDCFPVDFNIEVSMDGDTWTTVVSEENFARPEKRMLKFTIPETKAKFVLINANKLSYINNTWTDNKNFYMFSLSEVAITNE